MAPPVETNGPVYKPVSLLEYNLSKKTPPHIRSNDREMVLMAKQDSAFGKTLLKNGKIANPFVARQNHFFHDIEPPEKWAWSKTHKRVREYLLTSLKNHGRLAIKQKEQLNLKIGFVENKVERYRLLKQCNDQLVHAWYLLDAFGCYDEEVKELCEDADRAWTLNPDMDCEVREYVEKAPEA